VRELVCQLKHLVDEYDVEQGDAFAAAAALEHMGALWPEVD
jgi:hypothetical protein